MPDPDYDRFVRRSYPHVDLDAIVRAQRKETSAKIEAYLQTTKQILAREAERFMREIRAEAYQRKAREELRRVQSRISMLEDELATPYSFIESELVYLRLTERALLATDPANFLKNWKW